MPYTLEELRKMRDQYLLTKGWHKKVREKPLMGREIYDEVVDDTDFLIALVHRANAGNTKIIASAPSILDQLIEQLEWRESLRGKVEGMVTKAESWTLEGLTETQKAGVTGRLTALDAILELINQK